MQNVSIMQITCPLKQVQKAIKPEETCYCLQRLSNFEGFLNSLLDFKHLYLGQITTKNNKLYMKI